MGCLFRRENTGDLSGIVRVRPRPLQLPPCSPCRRCLFACHSSLHPLTSHALLAAQLYQVDYLSPDYFAPPLIPSRDGQDPTSADATSMVGSGVASGASSTGAGTPTGVRRTARGGADLFSGGGTQPGTPGGGRQRNEVNYAELNGGSSVSRGRVPPRGLSEERSHERVAPPRLTRYL